MAVAVAEMERMTRHEPDFGRIQAMIDAGLEKHAARLQGMLTYRKLGPALGYSSALIGGIVTKHNRPEREVLIALADFFNDPREEWLEAGGFDVESLPRDRGFTTAERTVARWLTSLSVEDREALLRRATEEQHNLDGEV